MFWVLLVHLHSSLCFPILITCLVFVLLVFLDCPFGLLALCSASTFVPWLLVFSICTCPVSDCLFWTLTIGFCSLVDKCSFLMLFSRPWTETKVLHSSPGTGNLPNCCWVFDLETVNLVLIFQAFFCTGFLYFWIIVCNFFSWWFSLYQGVPYFCFLPFGPFLPAKITKALLH